jgi:hypothetical protein
MCGARNGLWDKGVAVAEATLIPSSKYGKFCRHHQFVKGAFSAIQTSDHLMEQKEFFVPDIVLMLFSLLNARGQVDSSEILSIE